METKENIFKKVLRAIKTLGRKIRLLWLKLKRKLFKKSLSDEEKEYLKTMDEFPTKDQFNIISTGLDQPGGVFA